MSRLVRKGRWVGSSQARRMRMFADDIVDPYEYGDADTYAEFLVARLGRPMERAIIRAHLRYQAQKRRHLGIHELHLTYRRKKR